jgi:hypothetical protein
VEFEKGDLNESYGLYHIQYVKSLIYKINLYIQVNSRSVVWRFLKPRTLSISFSSVVISTLPQVSNLVAQVRILYGGSSYKYVIVREY